MKSSRARVQGSGVGLLAQDVSFSVYWDTPRVVPCTVPYMVPHTVPHTVPRASVQSSAAVGPAQGIRQGELLAAAGLLAKSPDRLQAGAATIEQ